MFVYHIYSSFETEGHCRDQGDFYLLKTIISFNSGKISIKTRITTVKTLYNVTRYNRILNIRHKIAGNGSVSIKIPSL